MVVMTKCNVHVTSLIYRTCSIIIPANTDILYLVVPVSDLYTPTSPLQHKLFYDEIDIGNIYSGSINHILQVKREAGSSRYYMFVYGLQRGKRDFVDAKQSFK